MRRVVVGVRLQEVEAERRVVPPAGKAQPRAADGGRAGLVGANRRRGRRGPRGEDGEGNRPRHTGTGMLLGDDPVGLVQQVPGVNGAAEPAVRPVPSVACGERRDDAVDEMSVAGRVGQPRPMAAHARAAGLGRTEDEGVIEKHRHHGEPARQRQREERVEVVERAVEEAGRPARLVDGQAAARVGEDEPAHHLDAGGRHGGEIASDLVVVGQDAVPAPPHGRAEVAPVAPPRIVHADRHRCHCGARESWRPARRPRA